MTRMRYKDFTFPHNPRKIQVDGASGWQSIAAWTGGRCWRPWGGSEGRWTPRGS